ncbi:MAG: flippase-like domain-containing protein, partial [Solirubrobacteraceae bacterium]|nr:flippase-like domain-containing protein [Solirubrobacteraceae bacterium]
MAPKVGDRLEGAIGRHVDVAAEIEREEREEQRPKHLVRKAVWLVLVLVSVTLVAPSVLGLLESWEDVASIGPEWVAAMVGLEAAALLCLAALQYLAIPGSRWRPIVTSQLAGNAMSKIAPGGGAVGAALQYRMLARAGLPKAATVAGLTAANLLTFAVVLAMPVGAIPAIIRGLVPQGLLSATIGGAALFIVLAGLGAVCMARDRPLEVIGTGVQRARNRLRRGAAPIEGLPGRLLGHRDELLA